MPRSKRKGGSGGSFGRRPLRSAGTATERERAPRWLVTLSVVGIFLLALFVRFYGLSHDLREGNVYHPDVPKQIDAADRFLRGHYYYKSPNASRDIDGYPYFNMHLVEYEWRGVAGVRSVLEYFMGWRRELAGPHDYPDLRIKLFVLTRISVCVMSALVVLVIYGIGRETWGVLVGLIAAGLAALSPLSVEGAHYGMSDSVMDLFVCLTVLVAMRMYRSPRLIYPPLAGLLGAFAFAAKYNGGAVLIFVALMHVLKYASLRRLVSARAMRDAGLVVVGALVGLFVAIPAMLIYPDRMAKDMLLFSRLASQFRKLPEGVGGSWWSVFRYAAGENLSKLMNCAGLIVPIGAVAGFVISVFRNRRHVLLGLFPLLYIVLALARAGDMKPYYFSVVILFFCVYFAVVTDWLAGLKKLRIPAVALAVVLVAAGVVPYAVRVARSNFFFWHMSSRRVATAWVNENIPERFRIEQKGRYALYAPDRSEEDVVETLALAASNVPDWPAIPEDSVALGYFHLEEKRPITGYRNPSVRISLLAGSQHLKAGFAMPVSQRLPSETGNEFVFPLGAEFLRSGRFLGLRSHATRRIFVMPEAPAEVVLALRNGGTANVAALSFGAQEQEVALEPLEMRLIVVEKPRRMPLFRVPFYTFWARAPFECQVQVAVTDEQKGVLYYNAAEYAAALPHLVAAWRERPGPVLAQMAVVAAACSGKDLDKLEGGAAVAEAVRADLARSNESFFERFGISLLYLNELRYIEREAEAFARTRNTKIERDVTASGDSCVMPRVGSEEEWSVTLGDLFLEAGWYRVTLRVRVGVAAREDAAMTVSFVDTTGQIIYDSAQVDLSDAIGGEYRDVECSLEYADRLGPATLKIEADPSVPLRLDRLVMRPDFERQVAARDRLVRAILDENVSDLEPDTLHLEPLLAYGESAAVRGEAELALVAYQKAAAADPGSYRPYVAMRRILDGLPEELKAITAAVLDEVKAYRTAPARREVFVRFKNGLELIGSSLSSDEYASGDTIEMTLSWRVRPQDVQRYTGRALFIHFIPEGQPRDAIAFQGDTDLVQGLRFNERLDRIRPVYRHPIEILPTVPRGHYDIEVGIVITMHQKRIRVVEANVPHTNNSATIGRVRIVPREEAGEN